MTPRELEEYRSLRATIRERGTARLWIFGVGMVGWGGVVTAAAALATLPVATLLPLLVLAAQFEAILALHLGGERIGRYLQVFFEDDEGAGAARGDETTRRWETTTMAYGGTSGKRSSGGAPLFSSVFAVATILNFVPVLVAEPVAIELYVVGGAHLAFLSRLVMAHSQAARQRAIDLERFQQLRKTLPPGSSSIPGS